MEDGDDETPSAAGGGASACSVASLNSASIRSFARTTLDWR